MELIPKEGAAMIVAYHGFIPSDVYLLPPQIYFATGRMATILAADFVFRIPIFGYLAQVCGGRNAARSTARQVLSEGGILMLSPGGVKESLGGSSRDYSLIWDGKQGFADMALECGVPIIPMFSQNIRHVFVTFLASTRLVQWLYQKTKLPFALFIGPLPVKLTTFFGRAIPTAEYMGIPAGIEKVAARTGEALEALMHAHQGV